MRFTYTLWTIAMGASLALALSATAPHAGEKGCHGQCYEEVPAPAYSATFKRRVEIEPGAYEIAREPSLYGRATRRVLLDSGVEWRERPAVYKTVKVRQHLKSRVTWEKRWINGKYVMCKVRVPGQTVWTHREVLVSPARRWKERSAPVYGTVEKRILLRPYKNIAIYNRARHAYVRERVVIQPEGTVWAPVSVRAEKYR